MSEKGSSSLWLSSLSPPRSLFHFSSDCWLLHSYFAVLKCHQLLSVSSPFQTCSVREKVIQFERKLLLKGEDVPLWAPAGFFGSDIWTRNETPVQESSSADWRIWGGRRVCNLDNLVKEGDLHHQAHAWVSTNPAHNLYNNSTILATNTWGYLLRAVRRLTLRWKLQILSYFYSFQSFQSIFGLYMMKQYVVKLRKLFPQFYTVFFVFDVTPW